MPQELRVVCCFQCRKFQSDIVKKAKKWTCKLCGAQQSLVKEYARGSGRECRLLVQQLSDGSLQADQMERLVAEQVLTGELVLPSVAENPIREESDLLAASHEQNRKNEGNRGSKWDSFCLSEDAEEEDIAATRVEMESSRNPWKNWGKGNLVDRGKKNPEKTENLFALNVKTGFEQPTSASKLIPMGEFHRMDKQETQFKWLSNYSNQSYFAPKSSIPTTKTAQENKKPFFSFKPKTSPLSSNRTLDASQSKENVSLKRPLNSTQLPASQPPMMSFAKKSKWTQFNLPELELTPPSATPDCNESFQASEPMPQKSETPASSSKWSKFISQADEEDDEFT